MLNFILFIILIVILLLTVSVSFSTYLAQSKGYNFLKGFWWGLLLPFFGIIVVAMWPQTDANLTQEFQFRNLNIEKKATNK